MYAKLLVILAITVALALCLTAMEQQNVAAFNDKNQEQIHQNSKQVCSQSFGCQVAGGSTENSAGLHVNSNSIPSKDSQCQCQFFTKPRTGGNH